MHIEGLFDRLSFPDRLEGNVVTPDREPRIHGYAVRADLAANAGVVDTAWLSLTGELPTESEREALQTALIWLAPLHVGESPAHAAVLARLAGAPDEVVPAIAAIALGQHTAAEIRALGDLERWLDGDEPPPDAAIDPRPDSDALALHDALVASSARWFGRELALPSRPVLSRTAGAYALLYRLGVGDPARLQALSLWARLPVMMAEALCVKIGAVKDYPAKIPAYRYTEDER